MGGCYLEKKRKTELIRPAEAPRFSFLTDKLTHASVRTFHTKQGRKDRNSPCGAAAANLLSEF
jgi:hypothetical protein